MADITLRAIKERIVELMGDSEQSEDLYADFAGTQTSAKIMLDGVVSAMTAVSSRVWKHSVFETQLTGSSALLPGDLIDIESVFDLNTKKPLPSLPLSLSTIYTEGWLKYPQGQITFLGTPPTEGIRVYYSAIWASPDADYEEVYDSLDDYVFDFPPTLLNAVVFYSTSYCFLQRSSQAAVLRQYNTKVDSGNPLDNPLLAMATEFRKLFDIELNRFPQSQKGVTF